MAAFHIIHIQPPVVTSTRGQWEVVRLLSCSLESLGHSVTVGINEVMQDTTNIVLGYERLARNIFPPGTPFIVYQLEQLGHGGGLFTPIMEQILKAASEVWDYSPHNLKQLQEMGITRARLLPLGYHERLQTIRPVNEKIDVLFYGLMNDRRRKVLDDLRKECKVQLLEYVYGGERDYYIARSKITLNMHHYATQLGEQVRVSYLLNNGRCVVSEQSSEDPLRDLCTVVPYDQIVRTCLDLLKNEEERKKRATAGLEGFRQRPMTAYLQAVL